MARLRGLWFVSKLKRGIDPMAAAAETMATTLLLLLPFDEDRVKYKERQYECEIALSLRCNSCLCNLHRVGVSEGERGG
jgi:hypothetical protein